LEVPEVASGTVQIKNIAREAGSRSKIAVVAKEDNIDPIGSCVGQRGTRVQTIINELGGEKIDIIEWQDDPKKYIAKALAPAKVVGVEVVGGEAKKEGKVKEKKDEGEKNIRKGILREAKVKVAADQLSLAIGKEGQNVRLAAKLTGWKIDIVEAKSEVDSSKKKDINKIGGSKGSESSESSKLSKSSELNKKEKEEDKEDKKEIKREKNKEEKVKDTNKIDESKNSKDRKLSKSIELSEKEKDEEKVK